MHDPITHALLCIAHTLETHHGLVFEYADGAPLDAVQRLDFAQDHAYLTQVLQAIDPAPISRHAGPRRAAAHRMNVSPQPRKGWCAAAGFSLSEAH